MNKTASLFSKLLATIGANHKLSSTQFESESVSAVYDLELTCYHDNVVTEKVDKTCSLETALSWTKIEHIEDFALLVCVTKTRGSQSWTDDRFLISCNAKRAYVRIHAYCEHNATDPELQQSDDKVLFYDEGNEGVLTFSVSFHETISREQAFEALRFWLTNQERIPSLKWS